jgi:UDP-arabinose 4-epimerase
MVINAVERVTGRRVPVESADRRPGDPPTLVADPSLARHLIRFEPRHSDLETIVETAWRPRAQTGRGHHTGIPTPFTPS